MAYLKWGNSPWFAYARADGGEEDDDVLVAWHERGACASVAAGELLRAGCEGRPGRLRDFMAGRFGADESTMTAAMDDIDALAPAVDQFLFEIFNAGKIPMPPDVANRYRELAGLIKTAVKQPRQAQAVDSRGFPMWFAWCAELDEINRRHPPPRLPRDIRSLMHARALRMLQGEDVSAAQDEFERARIAAAVEWPPLVSGPYAETRRDPCDEPVTSKPLTSTRSSAIAVACAHD